jgi:ATP-dependent Clp protease ATP-binding subunit ClpC
MLLQIMEEGRLTDSFGRYVDFRNTILIMTSNIGADLIKGGGGFGFQPARRHRQLREDQGALLMKEIERFFRPEFINRLDEVIVLPPAHPRRPGPDHRVRGGQGADRLRARARD